MHCIAHGMHVSAFQFLPYSTSKKSLQLPASLQNDRSEHKQGVSRLPALLPATTPCSLQKPWKAGRRHV